MPNALLLYYSYTNQTRLVSERIAAGLTDGGWQVERSELDYASGPIEYPLTPFAKRAKELSDAASKEQPVPVSFDASIVDRDWDLVLLGTPTWNHFPAVPVSSFLQTPAAHVLLSGRPFGAFIACRGFWRHNRRRLRILGERAGGRWVGGSGYTFDGNFFQTMHAMLHNQMKSDQPDAKLFGLAATPYGVSDQTLARARNWGTTIGRSAGVAVKGR